LRKIYIALPILLLFLFIAGVSLAQDIDSAQNSTGLANNTGLNESMSPPAATSAATPNDNATGTTADNTANASAPNLKYIWSITGIEDDQVIMALDQDGSDLFGQAKYEPDSGDAWNGNVAGSITGNQVDLTITAQRGTDLESIKLDGAFADDALSGKFTKISGGKITSRGDFNAIWINPDISTYEPAKVTEAAPQSATVPAQTVNTSPSTATDQSATGQSTQPAVQTGGKTQYVDVHKYAEQYEIGGDLSGVPPGMGGSGGL
jgi:hypothetical protein